MAVTSIWPYKNTCLKCINYVMNPDKTNETSWVNFHIDDLGNEEFTAAERKEDVFLVSGINVDVSSPERAAKEFQYAKDIWNKNKGRQCYHGYQSFAEGEISPEEAHQIGKETASRLWGNRFQVVVATHINTGHIHNHFVLNSVSIEDGYKFYNTPEDYQSMKRVSDEICQQHGLSVIMETDGNTNKVWRKSSANKPYTREQICRDIDYCISSSESLSDVYELLGKMGYSLKVGEKYKYPALSPPGEYDKNGMRRYFRFKGLNKEEGYSIDDIEKRIQDPEYDDFIFRHEIEKYNRKVGGTHQMNQFRSSFRKKTTIRIFYIHRRHRRRFRILSKRYYDRGQGYYSYLMYSYYKYMRLLNTEQKHQNSRSKPQLSFQNRKDMRQLNKFSQATVFAASKQIQSFGDAREYGLYALAEIAKLTLEKKKLLKKNEPDKVDILNHRISELRRERDLCNFICDTSGRVSALSKESSMPKFDTEAQNTRKDRSL